MQRFLIALTLLLVIPGSAHAFCGFYVSGADGQLFNDATQVALMRHGRTTVLSMRNTYQGPPEDFAMVVPVPVVLQEENVKTLPHKIFDEIDRMAAPRLVEYWETDPCNPYVDMPKGIRVRRRGMKSTTTAVESTGSVRIEAQFKVGEYEIVILSATDSMALDTWLRGNNYNIPKGAEAVLKPYIQSGMFFFVAKVDLKKVKQVDGRAVLSPLRFHYESDTFSLPVRLGLLNANGPQDLIIHILAQNQRYEVANYPNVTIPTNIEVHESVKGNFGSFYAALFDATVKKNPAAVVTEYSWSAASCDPCPGPTLNQQHFTTLGADVIPGGGGWTLTRLHARYTAAELKDDLVFKAAPPIVGGREFYKGKHGHIPDLENGASSASINNFQGRYIIRHPWTGKIACENPQRGVWGGPPGSGGTAPNTQAAQDVAFAPRGTLKIADHLAEDVSALGLKAAKKRKVVTSK